MRSCGNWNIQFRTQSSRCWQIFWIGNLQIWRTNAIITATDGYAFEGGCTKQASIHAKNGIETAYSKDINYTYIIYVHMHMDPVARSNWSPAFMGTVWATYLYDARLHLSCATVYAGRLYPKSYATMYMMWSAKRAILYVEMRGLYRLTGLMHYSRVETCTSS